MAAGIVTFFHGLTTLLLHLRALFAVAFHLCLVRRTAGFHGPLVRFAHRLHLFHALLALRMLGLDALAHLFRHVFRQVVRIELRHLAVTGALLHAVARTTVPRPIALMAAGVTLAIAIALTATVALPLAAPGHTEVEITGAFALLHHPATGMCTHAGAVRSLPVRAGPRTLLAHRRTLAIARALPLVGLGHTQRQHGCHGDFLISESLDVHPDALASTDEFRERAWQTIEPRYLERVAGLVDIFGSSKSKELAADDLAEVARAAVGGRVATLLIEARREIPGRVDASTGELEFDDLSHPELDDVLDDLGALVLKMGREVVVVPRERMPTETGIAAIYRY